MSAEARAAYIAGAGASKDQLEELVADETHALIGHYRIVSGVLYKGFGTASELGDGNARFRRRVGAQSRCMNAAGTRGDSGPKGSQIMGQYS